MNFDPFLVGNNTHTEWVDWGQGVMSPWGFNHTYWRWRSRSFCLYQPGAGAGRGTSASGHPTAESGSVSGTGCRPAPTGGPARCQPPRPPRSGWGWDTPPARSSWSESAGGLSLGPTHTAGVCLEHLQQRGGKVWLLSLLFYILVKNRSKKKQCIFMTARLLAYYVWEKGTN